MKKIFPFILISSLFATYNVGDAISDFDQQQIYDVCAGTEDVSSLTLGDYAGNVIWINFSASW
tara:strand:+ start:39 stop:227 length:189 start_codon:yes stop_codon:yes gene_type:complete